MIEVIELVYGGVRSWVIVCCIVKMVVFSYVILFLWLCGDEALCCAWLREFFVYGEGEVYIGVFGLYLCSVNVVFIWLSVFYVDLCYSWFKLFRIKWMNLCFLKCEILSCNENRSFKSFLKVRGKDFSG